MSVTQRLFVLLSERGSLPAFLSESEIWQRVLLRKGSFKNRLSLLASESYKSAAFLHRAAYASNYRRERNIRIKLHW